MKEVIRKFDDSISIKANKSQITLLTEMIKETYIDNNKWDLINIKFAQLTQGVLDDSKNLDLRFEAFKEFQRECIDD